MYNLRDKTGVLKAQLSDSMVSKVMGGSAGFFRPSRSTPNTTVYEISEAGILTIGGNKIFLWGNDTLVKD